MTNMADETFGLRDANATLGQGSGVVAETKPEGIVPMVIQQILECPESRLRLYDMSCGIVELVAIVRSVDHSSTKISYKFEDHTGRIDGYVWLEEESEAEKFPSIAVNTYAKVFASLRNHGGTKSLIIFKIESVTKINELTTHLLQVLSARFTAEHYAAKNKAQVGVDFQTENATQNNIVRHPASNATQSNIVPVQHPLGLEGKDLALYTAICSDPSDQGISFQELERKFAHISKEELTSMIEFMMQEGVCYTSIDADHFKCN